MSTKGELFQEYLDKAELNVFTRQDVKDEVNTSIFRTAFGVEEKNVPVVIIVDDSAFCMIQVQLAAEALNDGNKARLFELINNWNTALKPFKFIFDSKGNLVLVCCLLNEDGKMDGDKVNAMLSTILDYLMKEYKNIVAAMEG